MKSFFGKRLTKTHTRFLVMILLLAGVFLILFLLIYKLNNDRKNQLKRSYQTELLAGVQAALAMKTDELYRVIYDYTYWDELVSKVEQPDSSWYPENISTILTSFHFDFAALQNLDGSFRFVDADTGLTFSMIVPDEVLPILYRDRFISYYISTPSGLIRVTGGTIHPTNDPGRVSDPRGYMFLGRIWNEKVMKDMQTVTGATVRIDFESADSVSHTKDGTIHAYTPILNWEGKQIGTFVFTKKYAFIDIFRNHTRLIFTLILLFVISSLGLIWWSSKCWVGKPLQAVNFILKDHNRNQIEHLKKLNTEFREIGYLFEDFLNQSDELVKARLKAEESDRLKTAFLANMSHEIRTPMNGILGFAELLKDTELTAKERSAYIEIILRSGRSLLTIINDIIDISKIEAGLMTIDLKSCNLNQILNETLSFFSKHDQVVRKGLEIRSRKQFADEASNLVSDPIRLNQILTNLIGNAVKFTEKGFVEVGYRLQDAYTLLVYVKDSGIGISDDKKELIFDRFVQADNSHTRQFEGTGLGLAITRALVELMRGDLWVESVPGEGSTFYVSLPYIPIEARIETVEVVKTPERIPNYTGKTILVAEDVEDNFQFFKSVLQKTNARVIWVKNGREAVEKALFGRPPDLILMDLRMPVMNGYDATREIKSQKPQIPIIAQTAYSLDGDRSKSMEAGCDEYIAKPIDIQTLYSLIDRFIGTFGI